MRKFNCGVCLIAIMLIWFSSCTDIIEPNISEEKVVLLAPSDSIKTIYSSQTFWWEEVTNANSYNIQIVAPDFDFIERLILDTVIETNKFSISLYPGQYQWQVRALNYSYGTSFTTNTLFIDSTLDLSHQLIVLVSPNNNDTSNVSYKELRWEYLYNATNYVLVIENQEGIILNDTVLTNTYSVDIASDGNYVWKVKAYNTYTETVFFQRNFFYYSYIPNAPSLNTPTNESIFNSTDLVQFSWSRDEHTVPSIKDSIYISNDSLFSNYFIKDFLKNPNYESEFEQGVYYWKVKSIDKAGNKSGFSETRKYSIYN